MSLGTAFAQALVILSAPILTRMFTPSDFGGAALYSAICAILGSGIAGRYDSAIPLPKRDSTAMFLIDVCADIAFVAVCTILILLLPFSGHLELVFPGSQIASWWWLLPAALFVFVMSEAIVQFLIRKASFKAIAISQVVHSAGNVTFSVGLGFLNLSSMGIILGRLFGNVISLIYLVFCIKPAMNVRNGPKFNRLRKIVLMRKYANFPKYLVVAHLLNNGARQFPVILLTWIFSGHFVGLFALAQRTIALPVSVVSQSVGRVFLQKASEEFKIHGNCRVLYLRTLLWLSLIAGPPLVLLFIFAPNLFEIAFGSEWRKGGEYCQILIPMIFFQFVTSPLSHMFIIAEKQKYDLYWQVFLFVISNASLAVAALVTRDPSFSLIVFSASYSIAYVFNSILSFNFASNGERAHAGA